MLAPADAAIVARDSAIPGLALVLDPEAMAQRLAGQGREWASAGARATYVRYKPSTSCLVAYRVDAAGAQGPVELVVKAYRQGDGAKLAKARAKAGHGEAATLEPEMVVVSRPVADRDLPGARRLARSDVASTHARRRLLRRLLPEEADLWEGAPRVLRYKPERRWVAVMERDGAPVALIKAYRRRRFPSALAGLHVAAQASLPAPRLLGTEPEMATQASSWVPGDALSDLLAQHPRPTQALHEAGAVVARLHGCRPVLAPDVGLTSVSPGADVRALAAAASLVATVLPDTAALTSELYAALAPRLAGTPGQPGVRHGDLSPDQVIWGPAGAALVDLDDVAGGAVEADLGHFGAALVALELGGRIAGGGADSRFEDFVDGYAGIADRPADDDLAAQVAAALVRLAVEPFRLRAPAWPERTAAILDAARYWSATGSLTR